MSSNADPWPPKALENSVTVALRQLLQSDPYLEPFAQTIFRRLLKIEATEMRLTGAKIKLADFALGHEYFGLHFQDNQWILREWAPNASQIYLIGDMTGWQEIDAFALDCLNDDKIWEIRLPTETLKHLDLYRLRIHWPGGEGDRIPVYARRVVQDPETQIFNAQVWSPENPFNWHCRDFRPEDEAPLIYEAHIGMAQEKKPSERFRNSAKMCCPGLPMPATIPSS